MSKQQQALRAAIDRMVEEAIRRILPTVMNEVLLKTIASSGVLSERAAPAPRATPAQPKSRPPVAKGALRHLLDESAGAEMYEVPDPGHGGGFEYRDDDPPQAPTNLNERIQQLPPELQAMAEGMDLSDMGGGAMWGEDEPVVPTAGPGPRIDEAARAIGLDFGRMGRLINAQQKKEAQVDPGAKARFDEMRIARLREKLDTKP